jgi:hypothetical protein
MTGIAAAINKVGGLCQFGVCTAVKAASKGIVTGNSAAANNTKTFSDGAPCLCLAVLVITLRVHGSKSAALAIVDSANFPCKLQYASGHFTWTCVLYQRSFQSFNAVINKQQCPNISG